MKAEFLAVGLGILVGIGTNQCSRPEFFGNDREQQTEHPRFTSYNPYNRLGELYNSHDPNDLDSIHARVWEANHR